MTLDQMPNRITHVSSNNIITHKFLKLSQPFVFGKAYISKANNSIYVTVVFQTTAERMSIIIVEKYTSTSQQFT